MEEPKGERLATLLSTDVTDETLWTPQDLADLFEHQLETPLAELLGGSEAGTLQELITSSTPDAQSLTRVKEFAKACLDHPDGVFPREVSGVLYWLALACGVVAGVRVSSLDDLRLAEGFAWAMSRQWLQPAHQAMFANARQQITGGAA